MVGLDRTCTATAASKGTLLSRAAALGDELCWQGQRCHWQRCAADLPMRLSRHHQVGLLHNSSLSACHTSCTGCLDGSQHARAGFRVHQDKLDGYLFFVPEQWLPVTVCAGLSHQLISDMYMHHASDQVKLSPCADLRQRHLLPQPLQCQREPVCGRVFALVLKLCLRRGPGAARGGGQAHAGPGLAAVLAVNVRAVLANRVCSKQMA